MYSKLDGARTNIIRTNSCDPPELVLLERVLNNNVDEIKNIKEELLTHIYPKWSKPILLVACLEEKVNAETIEALLNAGADVRFSDEDQWEALHFAAKRADPEILDVIIKKLDCDINTVLANSSNALHILIRFGNSSDEGFRECAKLLIEAGIDVNLPDSKSMSPVLWAAKKNCKDIIKVILEMKYDEVDLDSHKSRGHSARDLIILNNLYDEKLPEKLDNNNLLAEGDSKQEIKTLFGYLKQNQTNKFKNFKNGNIKELVNSDNGCDTLLQFATDKGNKEIVEYLIKKDADKDRTTEKNKKTPLEIAAEHGFHEILEILLQGVTNIPNSVLISLLKYYDAENFQEIDRKKCCEHIFNKLKDKSVLLDLNEGDNISNNSPLHYAVRYGNHAIINQLLDNGASLGSKSKFGFMPIQDIEPDLLKNHLDSCVQFDVKDKKDKEDFSISFKYRTLVPPAERKKKPDSEVGINDSNNQDLVHETEVISYMSTAPEFKHLLAHPVIVSFLFMKWHRIRWLFYTNLAFYVAFFVALVVYVFSYYCNFAHEFTPFENFLRVISYTVLLITFIVLVFREFFQIVILPWRYCKNFENYVEVILIVLAGSILFVNSPSVNTRKQLSSVSILLAAFELVLMVGQHPKLSTNVVMLKTVSYNFFKFLLWYSLLIIAFALSFYILFTKVPADANNNNNEETDDDDSFTNAGNSVFKTIVMLTGEFEASDINFSSFPIVSKLIFVLFIFMIAIILLNLLNGLAVSDTQMIKNDAELLGHISRAQHIRYVEDLLLGDIVPKNVFNKINELCCCLPFVQNWNYNIFKPLADRVCLFPHLFDHEMTVYPNRYGKVDVPIRKKQKCCYGCCYNVYLDRDTVRRSIELVQARKEQVKTETDCEQLEIEVRNLKNQIGNLEKLMQSINAKIDAKRF